MANEKADDTSAVDASLLPWQALLAVTCDAVNADAREKSRASSTLPAPQCQMAGQHPFSSFQRPMISKLTILTGPCAMQLIARHCTSSSMARKFAFFGPYITGPEAQELRARIHAPHVAELKNLQAAGVVKFGGPFYNDDGAGEGAAAAERAFGGTFLLLEAESREEALKIIEGDVYYKEGLWDIPQIRLVEYHPLSPYPF
ncbi:hypothetical protein B0H12DRAFT_1095284 [Mycena haematopus]|nr:hypothetical protein B0H12DRAFT_1095284 [Mycena haematopus]